MNEAPFSYLVSIGSILPGGKTFRFEADESQRRRLAEVLKIEAVSALAAELDVRPLGGRSFGIKGTLTATVLQTDVVTLESVRQDVGETIDVVQRPAEDRQQDTAQDTGEGDPMDFFYNGRIDLGVIVAEYLALGLDPYPREKGVVFEGYAEDDPRSDPSPFAALAGLKTPKD